jgi:hypothetical protein
MRLNKGVPPRKLHHTLLAITCTSSLQKGVTQQVYDLTIIDSTVKGKAALCKLRRYIRDVSFLLPSFLISLPDGGEWLA